MVTFPTTIHPLQLSRRSSTLRRALMILLRPKVLAIPFQQVESEEQIAYALAIHNEAAGYLLSTVEEGCRQADHQPLAVDAGYRATLLLNQHTPAIELFLQSPIRT